MKTVMNKTVLMSAFLISLTAFQAQASNYICLGVDEGDGFVTVNAVPTEDIVAPFGHAQGYELRLIEDQGMLSLTLKKVGSKRYDDVISIVSYGSEGLVFNQGKLSVNCVKDRKN
jgi:hypothetical protein